MRHTGWGTELRQGRCRRVFSFNAGRNPPAGSAGPPARIVAADDEYVSGVAGGAGTSRSRWELTAHADRSCASMVEMFSIGEIQ